MTHGEEFGRAMIKHSPLGISVRDANGRLLSVNQAWRDIWQIPLETGDEYMTTEKISRQFDDRGSYLGEWLPEVEKIYKSGGRLTIPELSLTRHPSGRDRWISQTFYALLDQEGTVDRVVILTNDITARKLAEKRLKTSKEFAENLLETANVLVVTLDPQADVTTFNRYAEELTGYTKAEVIGKNWFDLFIPQRDKETIPKVFEDALKNVPEVSPHENPIVTKGGEERQISWSNNILRDSSGTVSGVLSIGLDTTERKRAEEALAASQAQYEELFNTVQEGIGIVDENEIIRFANPAYAEMFEEDSVEQIIGRSLLDYIPRDQRDIVQEQTDFRKAAQASRYEIDIVTNEANRKTVHVSVSPRLDRDGKYIGAVGAVLDISDRKLTEEALRRKNVALREILEQISVDQEAIKQQIATNIDRAVMPAVARLRETANPAQQKLLDLLQQDLQEIASPFLDTLRHRYAKLTPRETELCRLIRAGMSSKEIAEMLNLSLGTVHKHREMIRRKLGLANEEINLATFLQSI